MNRNIADFIQSKKINSIQKLNFLLLLQRNPDLKGTIQEFAKKLHLGDLLVVEKIIHDFEKKGLLDRTESYYSLRNTPDLKILLQQLATCFNHPLTRQSLIDYVRSRSDGRVTLRFLPPTITRQNAPHSAQ